MSRCSALVMGIVLPVFATGRLHTDPVVMIAIDGLRPSELTSAASKDWHLPVLRGLLRDGAAAAGVRGVLPTLTLPNMVTLVTGAWPSDHGVVNNIRCGAEVRDDGGYYWYASDVKVETLWEAARQKGLKTANAGWTSTIGAAIDRNQPATWPHSADDDRGAAYGLKQIESYGPDLLTVFFESFDEAEHKYGLDTPEDRRALEHIDSLVGRLMASARRKRPDVTIVVVSDHGFLTASTEINLARAFADAGLLSVARPCYAGGSAYVQLADSASASDKSRVSALLDRLRTDPDNGIDRIIDHDAITARGGWKEAAYMVLFRPGYVSAARDSAAAPLRATSHYRGMHGYWPDDPAMYATFMIVGSRVPLKGSLGIVDMRDIAPTVAKLLGTHLTSATGKSLF